ncbi:MAG: MFS transporter [Proteobacteria bacterium]|nr:MFS transporter [Pseudomonadota bacterium]
MKTIIAEQDGASAATVTPARPMLWTLVSLSLSMLLPSLGTSSANVALPNFAQAFGAPFQAVQWIVLAYLLAITTLIVSVGRLGDMAGRRRLLLVGISLFTLSSAACGAAPSLWLLVAARAMQGVGAAIMMALTMAFVGETVPKDRTGSAMGLLGTMSAVGTAFGPSLGGVLIAGFGWPAIFLANVPLGIVTFVLAHRVLPEDRPAPRGGGFDGLGTLLLASTLAAYALAMTIGRGHFATINAFLLLAFVFGMGTFVFVEARVASPLVRPAMFRDPMLARSLVMNLLVSTVIMTTFVVGPFYLARGLGLDPAGVGLVMSIGPFISVLSGFPAGRLVDRWGARGVVVGGLAALAAGAFALAVLPLMFGLAGYIAGIAILTPGYQLFQAANNTTVMMDVQADRRGLVSGMLNLSRNLGLVTGASVMGAVFAVSTAAADIAAASPGALASGLRTTFAVAGVLMVVALALAIAGSVVTHRHR